MKSLLAQSHLGVVNVGVKISEIYSLALISLIFVEDGLRPCFFLNKW